MLSVTTALGLALSPETPTFLGFDLGQWLDRAVRTYLLV